MVSRRSDLAKIKVLQNRDWLEDFAYGCNTAKADYNHEILKGVIMSNPAGPENSSVSPDKIDENLGAAAHDIREYSRSQVGLWRRIPYLALQSEGNHGYGGPARDSLIYQGVLRLAGGAVDCDTGDIYTNNGVGSQAHLDAYVINTYLLDPNKLAAEHHLAYYQSLADEPQAEYMSRNPDDVVRWRSRLSLSIGLTAVFDRSLFTPPAGHVFIPNRIDQFRDVEAL